MPVILFFQELNIRVYLINFNQLRRGTDRAKPHTTRSELGTMRQAQRKIEIITNRFKKCKIKIKNDPQKMILVKLCVPLKIFKNDFEIVAQASGLRGF